MRSDWKISIRRACAAILFDPMTYRYKSRRPGRAALGQRIREICQSRVRFGYPKTIRVDQGSEFVSRDLDLQACQRGIELDFSRPGKPTENAFIEAFNAT
jgi:transposase InsO family protein